MKALRMLNQLSKIREEAKEELLKSNLRDIDKLRLLTEHKLSDIHYCVLDPTPKEWIEECNKMERQEADKNDVSYSSDYTDTYFDGDYWNRYETVMFIDIIDEILNNYKQDELITVVRNRGRFSSKVTKPAKILVRAILKHALENDIIGFKYDW